MSANAALIATASNSTPTNLENAQSPAGFTQEGKEHTVRSRLTVVPLGWEEESLWLKRAGGGVTFPCLPATRQGRKEAALGPGPEF